MDSKVDDIILNFLSFLNNTQKNIGILVQGNVGNVSVQEIRNDFFQANWEILVESIICFPGKEFLEVYGEGADCNADSSKVSFPDRMVTHYISCRQEYKNLVRDFYTDTLIDLSLYKYNSFGRTEVNDTSIKNYDSIILEHLTEDEYAMIKFDNIFFVKIKY